MFRRKRCQDDFNAEIEAHIQLEFEQLKEQGLSEEDTRIAARRAFGNVTIAREMDLRQKAKVDPAMTRGCE